MTDTNIPLGACRVTYRHQTDQGPRTSIVHVASEAEAITLSNILEASPRVSSVVITGWRSLTISAFHSDTRERDHRRAMACAAGNATD